MSRPDIYPAVFNYADDGITVTFPDFPDAVAEGQTEEDAYLRAKEALEGWIAFQHEGKNPVPLPINFSEAFVQYNENQRVQLIQVSNEEIRQLLLQKRVRRNITIPEYLSKAASKAGLNVSEIAAQALKEKLHL